MKRILYFSAILFAFTMIFAKCPKQSYDIKKDECINSCLIKQAYFSQQLNNIKIKYDKDTAIHSPIYVDLINLSQEALGCCNCALFLCRDCKVKETCCPGSDCIVKECVAEFRKRPTCLESDREINKFVMTTLEGKIIAQINQNEQSFDGKIIYTYPIQYLVDEIPDIYLVKMIEAGSETEFIVKFASS